MGLGLEFVLLVAALVMATTEGVQTTERRDLVVALLALAMGVQNGTVRRMSIPEANTTVLTSSLGSLAADTVSVRGRPPRAGRRTATVVCIFLGAIVGALLQRHSIGWPLTAALVLVAIAAVTLSAAGWPAPED